MILPVIRLSALLAILLLYMYCHHIPFYLFESIIFYLEIKERFCDKSKYTLI
jgi:hypothetical protein